MYSYLILTTRALLMAAVIAGVIRGNMKKTGEKRYAVIFYSSAVIGFLVSAVIAWYRNATNKLDSAIMNGWIYAVSLISFAVVLVLTIPVLRGKAGKILKTIRWIFLGISLITVIAYALPEVLGYPYHVLLSEKTVISTDFLMSMIGMTGGLILMAVLFLAASNVTQRLSEKNASLLLLGELILNAAMRAAGLYSVLFQKKLIKSNHTLFMYTVFVKNHSDLFAFCALALLLIAAAGLLVASFKQNEPYRNPAEHRKIRAKWRTIRRWSTAAALAGVIAVCNLTVVEAMTATQVTLSPIEDVSAVDDENVYVSFDLVNDGHLHRFAYTTDAGVQIRFIVIQKPGTQSYGIGLDACDVCGETGYYERDGQVVCNLCDVVMNISTIGFKGGCNPIVIPYEVSNGQIIVPISGLTEYEREFK